MKYSKDEVLQYVHEDDVKFIRLAFCDVFGRQKNISIMPDELERAFEEGIPFDSSAIEGFGNVTGSDLFIHPDPETIMQLPWRPEHGKVVRMYSGITYPDGREFELDTRNILKKAIAEASGRGIKFLFGTEQEFYLFCRDENDNPTKTPYDNAGYMDIAPDDRGENIRREICLTLEQMGIRPENSYHKEGPGQNEIDFRYSDTLSAADNAVTFQTVVKIIAHRNGLCADFSPKPIETAPGSGFHINIVPDKGGEGKNFSHMVGGIMEKIGEITLFLNPSDNSYRRFGMNKAPGFVSWSKGNRSQLIRITDYKGNPCRAEIRSPDSGSNPYLAFALLIYSAIYGIENGTPLPEETDISLLRAGDDIPGISRLPESLSAARRIASESSFVSELVPKQILECYCDR
ncbi:MAG: glutamine synthetase [Clostridia bacterium]|nr:glutamine synthetase [Clostridia bacterium]